MPSSQPQRYCGAAAPTTVSGRRYAEGMRWERAGWLMLVVLAACRPLGAPRTPSGIHSMPREPTASTRRLSSDLEVVSSTLGRAERVVLQLQVGAGSAQDPKGVEGLAHALEHVLVARVGRGRSGKALHRIVSEGGSLSAWTTVYGTVFQLTTLPRHLGMALDVLARVAEVRSIAEGELATARMAVRDEIIASRSNARQSIGRRLFAEAFAGQPLGQPVLGRLSGLERLNTVHVERFLCRHYQPGSITVTIAGPVKSHEVLAQVERAFARRAVADSRCPRASAGTPSTLRAAPDQVLGHGVRVVALSSNAAARRARLAVGFRIPGLRHDDTPLMDATATVLGQGEGCRLSRHAHLGVGLEDIDSFATSFANRGLFVVSAKSWPANLIEAVEAVVKEIFALSHANPPSDWELERAGAIIARAAELADAEPETVAYRLGSFQRLVGDAHYGRVYRGRLRAMAPGALRSAAARYLRPRNLTLVVDTPHADEQLERQLRDVVLRVYREQQL